MSDRHESASFPVEELPRTKGGGRDAQTNVPAGSPSLESKGTGMRGQAPRGRLLPTCPL